MRFGEVHPDTRKIDMICSLSRSGAPVLVIINSLLIYRLHASISFLVSLNQLSTHRVDDFIARLASRTPSYHPRSMHTLLFLLVDTAWVTTY